jgi:predicted ATPase
VAVVELGAMAGDRHGADRHGDYSEDGQASAVLQRITRQLGRGRASPPGGPDAELEADADMLLVLDNAEHIPSGVMAAVRELLVTHPGVHILVTTRRRLTQRLGVNREIQPLSATPPPGGALHDAPAVELFLRHVAPDSRTAAELDQDLPLIAELCRRLGGLPRNIEFAAECLRAIPIRLMLAHGPTPEMLWSNDQALLRHQRSATDSILWSLDLLSADHRLLLERIAGLRTDRFALDEITAQEDRPGQRAAPSPLTLVSDLLDTSLLLPDPVHRYRYRLAHFVRDVVRRRKDAEMALPGCG